MKTVTIGALEFSRAICGTNAFYARSHFSEARDAEYRERFTDAGIERVLRRCLELGINTVESSANERIVALLTKLRSEQTLPIRFIGSTRIDETSPMKSHQQKLECLIGFPSDICILHSQIIEHSGKPAASSTLKRMLDKIHEAGLLAGVSAHYVRVVEELEAAGYPIDTYLFPLNSTGFVYPGYDGKETPQQRADLVRSVSKPFILMKTLGAGRIPPQEALQFVAENCKKEDLVTLGIGSIDELEETIGWFEKYF